jgi:alpha-glucuronidase
MRGGPGWFIVLTAFLSLLSGASATPPDETGYEAWLRYPPIRDAEARHRYAAVPARIAVLGGSPIHESAVQELVRGVKGFLGRTLSAKARVPLAPAILVGTLEEFAGAGLVIPDGPRLGPEGYRLVWIGKDGLRHLAVAGADERGLLYGVFALLRRMALHEDIGSLDVASTPYAPVRWVNHWDNLDGTIERGYGGPSLAFEDGKVREDLSRVEDYARLLASLGVNGCAINNVNADRRVLSTEFLPGLARLAAVYRRWGVRIAVSIDFSHPQSGGDLDTFDPRDPRVVDWWKRKVEEVYEAVPDLAGFVLKADSEGRKGPSAYQRTHADAANVIARALAPHGGLLFYRGFVYDHHMDWRNLRNDRARASHDNFKPLDGKFDDNVLIQIKHGPIDFQVREPASPLFGALERTNMAVELQVTQEYFGQARHHVFLAPMWKEVLDFDMHAKGAGTPVKALAAGRVFRRPVGGFVGVANPGMDLNWFRHPLSQANLYGFGRLAWDPDLTAKVISDEWVRLTWGHDPQVVGTLTAMNLASWKAYEDYTGNLGMQTLTEITGNHYGPAVESSERNGWGQWHRADDQGVGMDRTVATGTGFIGQYRPAVARIYESLRTCPEELLLFMHHVPYTLALRSGATVLQHLYDAHFEGADAVAGWVESWRALAGRVDRRRHGDVLKRLEYQAGHAIVWRDAVCQWFRRTSGIEDARGRVGHWAGRVEAEKMDLEGYEVSDTVPWEGCSGGLLIRCVDMQRRASARFRYEGVSGLFTLGVQFFDQNNGKSRYRVFVGGRKVDEWTADDDLPTGGLNAHSSTRRWVRGIRLRTGVEVRIEGDPEGGEMAALDYVDIIPEKAAPR